MLSSPCLILGAPPPGIILPVKVPSKIFRGKFIAGLRRAFRSGKLSFHGKLKPLANPRLFRALVRSLYGTDWVVCSQKPFRGPEHVLRYLARCTHRVAISNHRLLSFRDNQVTFRWKDYAHGNKGKTMTVHADEFLRRCLLPVLARGFVRIRFSGFLSARKRTPLLPVCRALVGIPQLEKTTAVPVAARLFACPCGGAAMTMIQQITARTLTLPYFAGRARLDDSS